MECPSCGKVMVKEVSRHSGKVWAVCPECDIEIETKDLPPAFYDSEEGYGD